MSIQMPRFSSLSALAFVFVFALLASMPAEAQTGPHTPKGPGLTPLDTRHKEPLSWPPPPEDDIVKPRRPEDPPCKDWGDLIAFGLRDLHATTTPSRRHAR